MALTAAQFSLLLLVVSWGRAFRLAKHKPQRAEKPETLVAARGAVGATGESVLTADVDTKSALVKRAVAVAQETAGVMPVVASTGPAAAANVTEAFGAAVGMQQAEPELGIVKEATTAPSGNTSDTIINAVRGLLEADPGLSLKLLVANLQRQQPGLGAGRKEVREALSVLKAEEESEREAAEAVEVARLSMSSSASFFDEGGTSSDVVPSLACFGCGKLPSEMGDGRVKHPVCPKCRTLKLPTTYFCSLDCPAFPDAWKQHNAWHKEVKRKRKVGDDGGADMQGNRAKAELQELRAAQTGDKLDVLMAEGARYISEED